MYNTRILIFDSGAGGLSVTQELVSMHPDCDIIYVADTEGFPYGLISDEELTTRCIQIIKQCLSKYRPDIIVIACNTASTIALPLLREHFDLPFIGVVPAIKPAASLSTTGAIGVLATPATVERYYTKELINEFAEKCQVSLLGSDILVHIAESFVMGAPVDISLLEKELTLLISKERDRHIDTVVLACTHFPLLRSHFASLNAGKHVINWVDSGEAIARRVSFWKNELKLKNSNEKPSTIEFGFTSSTFKGLPVSAVAKHYFNSILNTTNDKFRQPSLSLDNITALEIL